MGKVAKALIALVATWGVTGCANAGTPATASSDAFCADALARVEAFTSRHGQPAGERYGGTAVVASYGELADGMIALVAARVGRTRLIDNLPIEL